MEHVNGNPVIRTTAFDVQDGDRLINRDTLDQGTVIEARTVEVRRIEMDNGTILYMPLSTDLLVIDQDFQEVPS